MDNKLTLDDLEFILESLNYTKEAFENYDKYPNHDYKQKRIEEVNHLISKIKLLKMNFNS